MGNLRYLQSIAVLGLVTLLGACAGQQGVTGGDTTQTGSGGQSGSTTSVRHCTDIVIQDSSAGLLSDFFTVVVSDLEGAPTICYEFNGTGDNIDANIMFEYEDRFGIRSLTLDDSFEVASHLSVNDDGSHVEVIWRDEYGLVKLFGRNEDSSGIVDAEIRFYQFPSYEEALNRAVEDVREECQNGTRTVYECLGYTYPTFWWNQPVSQSEEDQLLQMMKDLMAGGSGEYTVLGTVELDLGVSTWPQQ